MKIIFRKIFSIFQRVVFVLLMFIFSFILIGNICSIFSKQISHKVHTSFLGWSSAVVVSGSMADTIQVNDYIIIKSQSEYHVGDIITFNKDNSLVTHRIVAEKNGGFITKGDANNTEDSKIVQKDDIYGLVVLIIPKVGTVISFLKSSFGMMCLVLLMFLIILLPPKG